MVPIGTFIGQAESRSHHTYNTIVGTRNRRTLRSQRLSLDDPRQEACRLRKAQGNQGFERHRLARIQESTGLPGDDELLEARGARGIQR